MFYIVWKYTVALEFAGEFEKVYGPDGKWTEFFKSGKGYVHSQLLKSDSEEGEYLLMDCWMTAQDYHAFLEINRVEYFALSKQYFHLYETEVKTGFFGEIK